MSFFLEVLDCSPDALLINQRPLSDILAVRCRPCNSLMLDARGPSGNSAPPGCWESSWLAGTLLTYCHLAARRFRGRSTPLLPNTRCPLGRQHRLGHPSPSRVEAAGTFLIAQRSPVNSLLCWLLCALLAALCPSGCSTTSLAILHPPGH